MTGRRIRVSGRVQGVFFRNWIVGEAERHGVKGWVRNRTDGSVEILAFGAKVELAAFEQRCRQGPSAARVERVETESVEGTAPESFTRQATA